MGPSEISHLSERGVGELDMIWPEPKVIYEIKVERAVPGDTSAERYESYIDFLLERLFPLVDDLQRRAGIRYWHFYNHERVDLRISIESDEQMELVTTTLEEHDISSALPSLLTTYDDHDFGSRLGCQALLRLFEAQSTFVRQVLEAASWLRANADGDDDVRQMTEVMIDTLPVMSCHTQLNMFPYDSALQLQALLTEASRRTEAFTTP